VARDTPIRLHQIPDHPVTASEFHLIGKETERGREQAEDVSTLLLSLKRYAGNTGTANQLVRESLQNMSLNVLQKQTGLSRNTILRARRGERLQVASTPTDRGQEFVLLNDERGGAASVPRPYTIDSFRSLVTQVSPCTAGTCSNVTTNDSLHSAAPRLGRLVNSNSLMYVCPRQAYRLEHRSFSPLGSA
jgi:hypothetical protein